MKKILHIIPGTNYGGIQSVVLTIANNIDRKKFKFDYVAFNKGELHNEFLKEGSLIYYQDYITKQTPFLYIINLIKIIKKNNYDVVHDHTGYRAIFSMIAAKICNIKCRIVHSHTNGAEEWNNKLLLWLFRKINLCFSTDLIACSKSAGEFCFGNSTFKIIGNPIDIKKNIKLNTIQKNDFKNSLGIQENTLVLTHIGRFVPVKNHKFIVDIAKVLKNKISNFVIIFVGEGPLEEEIKSKIAKNKLEKNFIFLGKRKDIHHILEITDKFLLPSYFEGFGLVLLEAQIHGIQSIVSKNIPKEVDLEVGLIKYIDSFDEIAWCNEIIKKSNKYKFEITEALRKKEIDLSSVINKLEYIYNKN